MMYCAYLASTRNAKPLADMADAINDDDGRMESIALNDNEVPEKWCINWWNKRYGGTNRMSPPKKSFKATLVIMLE